MPYRPNVSAGVMDLNAFVTDLYGYRGSGSGAGTLLPASSDAATSMRRSNHWKHCMQHAAGAGAGGSIAAGLPVTGSVRCLLASAPLYLVGTLFLVATVLFL